MTQETTDSSATNTYTLVAKIKPGEVDNLTTTQIRDEFRDSRTIIEQQMSAILGTPFTVEGAAVPGNPEDFDTALDIPLGETDR